MKQCRMIISLFFATFLLWACGEEDEYTYPDLVTEMACLQTDAEGKGYQLLTDQGKVWYIPEQQQSLKLTPDSTYRVLSRYAPAGSSDGKQEANIYQLLSTISPLPLPESDYESIHTDPVSIQSIWRSGDYLNLILKVMVKEGEHEFSFIDNGIFTEEDGTQTLTLTLYHDRKEDVEGFYRKAYLSVPLWPYQNQLTSGDLITFRLNTYEEGMTARTFNY